jgi:hypothetical protein
VAGNEIEVANFLFKNLGKIKLQHLGKVISLGSPIEGSSGYYPIKNKSDIKRISSPDASKKADIYINGRGVSIKQTGACFDFNRLQRAEAKVLFKQVGFSDISTMISRLDNAVKKFHEGNLKPRSRPWEDFFSEPDFKKLLEYLMMKGSPNKGPTKHPAELIMEAIKTTGSIVETNSKVEFDIDVYTFDEYFLKYKQDIKIGVRRQWYGQKSNSEHRRAAGLIKKQGNDPWIFNEVSGQPRDGWRKEIPEADRKTVYFLMLEKIKSRC